MATQPFTLWLEFEHWTDDGGDPEDDFFNMTITTGGVTYALNVWTFRFFDRARSMDRDNGACLNGAYMVAPSLFVERLDRTHIEQVVDDLLASSGLRLEWVVQEGEGRG